MSLLVWAESRGISEISVQIPAPPFISSESMGKGIFLSFLLVIAVISQLLIFQVLKEIAIVFTVTSIF